MPRSFLPVIRLLRCVGDGFFDTGSYICILSTSKDAFSTYEQAFWFSTNGETDHALRLGQEGFRHSAEGGFSRYLGCFDRIRGKFGAVHGLPTSSMVPRLQVFAGPCTSSDDLDILTS
ncbi:hypothetical protein GOBAR_DD26043 [Gossypium barbadense]|nr:hypothetical protein GOBAR_DD26043 [Gossypium barbadense]